MPRPKKIDGEVAVRPATDLAVPAYYKSAKDMGTDSIDSSDLSIPRLKICQAQSRIKKTMKDLKDGTFYNTMTSVAYGPTVRFFIVLHWKSTVWFSDDFKLQGSEYIDLATKQTIHSGPEIQEILKDPDWYSLGKPSHNYMIVMESDLADAIKTRTVPTFIAYSAMGWSISPARQLNGALKYAASKGIPIYGQKIIAGTTLKENEKGMAFIPMFSIKADEFCDEQSFMALRELHKVARDMQSKVGHIADEEE